MEIVAVTIATSVAVFCCRLSVLSVERHVDVAGGFVRCLPETLRGDGRLLRKSCLCIHAVGSVASDI